jgi:squalene-hopene/tetraprenyl-beta-curcumene cyclase
MRTYNWIKSNQNSDGGFPAFDKDKNDNQYPAIKLIFKWTRIDKSAEIFDPSCPDIVGHFLEGMGECGIIDEDVIVKTVKYLYDTRKDGMWSARWGINYVYAVGAVFPGLARVGYSLDQEWILQIAKRLI